MNDAYTKEFLFAGVFQELRNGASCVINRHAMQIDLGTHRPTPATQITRHVRSDTGTAKAFAVFAFEKLDTVEIVAHALFEHAFVVGDRLNGNRATNLPVLSSRVVAQRLNTGFAHGRRKINVFFFNARFDANAGHRLDPRLIHHVKKNVRFACNVFAGLLLGFAFGLLFAGLRLQFVGQRGERFKSVGHLMKISSVAIGL